MALGNWPLQTAIAVLLKADAGIKALVGPTTARVYDAVPEDAPVTFPYITIGDMTVADQSSFGDQDGGVYLVDIHSWSRYRGRKELRNIMSAIHTALHRVTLTVSGYNHAGSMFESQNDLTEQDGLTRHGIQRFRITMQTT
jgi:hypothetical protein